MSQENPVLYWQDGPVATISLNRPEAMNAMNAQLLAALLDSCRRAHLDDQIRSVLITGNGRAFCAGGDLRAIAAAEPGEKAYILSLAGTLHSAILELQMMPKPTIAVVNGPAAGAGLSLALACDYRIMGHEAFLAQSYTASGLTPDGGLTWFLPRIVGLPRAQEIIFVNPRMDASAALQWGLVHRVVSQDQLISEGRRIAAELAAKAVATLARTRQLLLEGWSRSLAEQLELERQTIADAFTLPEGKTGVAAFLAKKTPIYDKNNN
jgi:2-(1,2-epoxy-1,2-dihydrophenyl)acetyl-CoA isomerase